MTATNEKTTLLPQDSSHVHRQQHDVSYEAIFWTSIFPQELVAHYSADFHKLGWVLQVIRLFLPCFYFMPVSWMLWLFRFTPEFGEEILYPLIAYFAEIEDDSPNKRWATCGMLYKVVFTGLNECCWDVEAKPVSTLRPSEVGKKRRGRAYCCSC